MREMTKWERVGAALHAAEIDRVPISLWKHYHLQDRAPGQLADLTLAFHRQFDTDLIKLTPSGLYPIQDWGPAIQFGSDDDSLPLVVRPVINSAGQWRELPRLDVSKGALRRELETIHHVAAGLDGSAPFMMTIFSPLNIAYKLCGDKLSGDSVIRHVRQAPRELHAGLTVIRDIVIDYAAACLEAGASGIFFATQMATADLMTPQEFEEFGKAYDLPVLESILTKSRVTMLHLCQQNLMFDLVADYPVDVINWAASAKGVSATSATGVSATCDSGVTLDLARRITDKPLAGGLSLDLLLTGTEEDVRNQVRAAIAQAGPRGFILAPDCVIKGPTPDANLAAVRSAAGESFDPR